MRATLRDVRRHPSWLAGWWLDLPLRRRDFWHTLLLDEGQGWLRWKIDRGFTGGWNGEPPDEYWHAPPLRRFWMGMSGLVFMFRVKLLNTEGLRQDYKGWYSPWQGTAWMRDPDRKQELWR